MADEDDQSLQDIWAKTIVAAMRDDGQRLQFDRILADILKRLTPLSAKLLMEISEQKQKGNQLRRGTLVRSFAASLQISGDEAAIVMDHLTQLRCVQHLPASRQDHSTAITALGRKLLTIING